MSHLFNDPSSTIRNRLKSPLLQLTAELRNRIYAYALNVDTIHIMPTVSGRHIPTLQIVSAPQPREHTYPISYQSLYRALVFDKPLPQLQALTAVCHQTRVETALLRYTANEFEIDLCELKICLTELPKEVRHGVCVLKLGMSTCSRPGRSLAWLRVFPALELVVIVPEMLSGDTPPPGAGDLVRAEIRKYVGKEIEVVDF
jgi:hypothetical protein